MAYVKTTWETGDIITADKLNNIENGIETAELAQGLIVRGAWDVGAKEYNFTIPDGTTRIRAFCFQAWNGKAYNGPSLVSVTIPGSVTEIWYQAFSYCDNLTSVTCLGAAPPGLDKSAFDGMNTANLVIYVPAASVEAYKAAAGWSTYAARIQAIGG